MHRIMFVCHGNICRSPMAEFIMKDLVKKAKIENEFYIASAAVSSEELGNPVYPPASRELAKHGISSKGKFAVKLTPEDYEKYDIFAVMDSSNLKNIRLIFRTDPDKKIHKLMEFAGCADNVADPWFTGQFDRAYNDILIGCEGLLKYLSDNERKYGK